MTFNHMAKTYHTVIKNYVLLNKVWKCTQGIIFIIKMVLYKNILVADWEYGTKKKNASSRIPFGPSQRMY